jgi:hypothetical protein
MTVSADAGRDRAHDKREKETHDGHEGSLQSSYVTSKTFQIPRI